MAFQITRDFTTRKHESDYAVGTQGPQTATQETLDKLDNGEGRLFRLLDDDDVVYYHGRFIDDSDAEGYDGEPGHQPLDCFGAPNAGAVIIQYRDANGDWETI